MVFPSRHHHGHHHHHGLQTTKTISSSFNPRHNNKDKERWWIKLLFGGGQFRWLFLVLPMLMMYMFALYQFQSSSNNNSNNNNLSSIHANSPAAAGGVGGGGGGSSLKNLLNEQQRRDDKYLSKKRKVDKKKEFNNNNNNGGNVGRDVKLSTRQQQQKQQQHQRVVAASAGVDGVKNNDFNNIEAGAAATKSINNNINNAQAAAAAPEVEEPIENKKISSIYNFDPSNKSDHNNIKPRILKLNDEDFTTTAADAALLVMSSKKSQKKVTDVEERKTGGNKEKHDSDDVETVEVMQTSKMKKYIDDDDNYGHAYRDPLWDDECMPMQPWQDLLLSSCNPFHELGFGNYRESSTTNSLKIIASGGYNQVYKVESNMGNVPMDTKDPITSNEPVVLKILEYDTKYTDRNFDRVRRDAMITERATYSKYIVDGLGHCGFALLTPIAIHGTMDDQVSILWKEKKFQHDDELKLKFILSAAFGLRDLHDIDHNGGFSAVAHDDLKMNQYMLVDGIYKLGDFNRGRFVRKNKVTGVPCPFFISSNDAKYRSPHEYIKRHPLTSKIDIWALGSLIFELLTGKSVWAGYDVDKTQKLIASKNATPPLLSKYKNSTNPIHMMVKKVMYEMCFVADPEKRSNAVEVADYLKNETIRLGYGHLIDEPWKLD